MVRFGILLFVSLILPALLSCSSNLVTCGRELEISIENRLADSCTIFFSPVVDSKSDEVEPYIADLTLAPDSGFTNYVYFTGTMNDFCEQTGPYKSYVQMKVYVSDTLYKVYDFHPVDSGYASSNEYWPNNVIWNFSDSVTIE